jgi:hypothetical protein
LKNILRKIESEKPSYGFEDEYVSSFESITIYVQNGLVHKPELFKVFK